MSQLFCGVPLSVNKILSNFQRVAILVAKILIFQLYVLSIGLRMTHMFIWIFDYKLVKKGYIKKSYKINLWSRYQ